MKRRTFLKSAAAGIAAAPFFLEGMPVRASSPLKYLAAMPQANLNNRILIICQLFGGNDGLNTIIPADDPLYYSNRTGIGIPKANCINYSTGSALYFAPN